MKNLARLTAIFTTVFFAASCTAVFQDDFEADPAGGAPLASPAGPPSDALGFSPGDGAVFVTTALPLEGAQSLKMEGPSGATTPRVVMTSAPISDQTRPVFISWTGRLASSAQVEIFVWVDFTKFPLRFNFEFGTVYLNGNSIGTFTQTGEHTVFISLTPNGDQYGVTLGGQADSGGTVSGTLADPADFPGSHIGLSVNLINAKGASGYWMDDVEITHWDPR